MLQQLETKIKDLAQKLEQSAANHNGLLGSMQTLRELYQEAMAAAPVIEAAIPVVEELVAVV